MEFDKRILIFLIFLSFYLFALDQVDGSATTTKKTTVARRTNGSTLGSTTTKKSDGIKTSRKPPVASKPPPTRSNAKFAKYKKTYKKTYSTRKEEEEAQKNYEANIKENAKINSNKNATFKTGETSDSDKSYEWKVQHRMGIRKPEEATNASTVVPRMLKTRMDSEIPDSANWTDWCSPIKDQSDCGACWAFAVTAVLEYLVNVIRDQMVLFSEQELVDCNSNNMNCDAGGWPTEAYNYIIESGISTSDEYPYLAYKDQCVAINFNPSLYINETYEIFLDGNEEELKSLVYNYGPIIVVWHATKSFTNYKSGVYYEEDQCPPGEYNHAFVVVGFGVDEEYGDYWLIRNSWGTSWGMNGYAMIARGVNLCSIAMYAMMPSSSMIV